jgi:hypothetical protein
MQFRHTALSGGSMSKEVEVISPNVPVARDSAIISWTPTEKALIGRDLNDEERVALIRMARHTGLDPLLGQLYGWVFNAKDREKRRLVLYTSIGGARLVADRKGVRDGMEEHLLVRKADGQKELIEHRYYDPQEHNEIISGTNTLWLRGSSKPFTHTCLMSAYRKTGKGSEVWDKHADTMILKCAEMGNLRKVAPHDLAGIFIREELEASYESPATPPRQATITEVKRRNTRNARYLPYEAFWKKFCAACEALDADPEKMWAYMAEHIGLEKNGDVVKPEMAKKAQSWLENDLETMAQHEADKAAEQE